MKIDDFYNNLNKPKFTPPKEIFSIVWMILYLLMAISAILVLLSPNSLNKAYALLLFLIQLILNLNWSCIFFVYKQLKKAFYVCLMLLVIVMFMTKAFFEQSVIAGVLQIPYCLWLILASILSYKIMQKNN